MSGLRIKVTRHAMPGLGLGHRGRGLAADRHDVWAARMEAAARRRVEGAWNLAGDRRLPTALAGLRLRDRSDQRLGVGVQRLGVERALLRDLDDLARYMTATRSEMCFTTPKSWAMKR